MEDFQHEHFTKLHTHTFIFLIPKFTLLYEYFVRSSIMKKCRKFSSPVCHKELLTMILCSITPVACSSELKMKSFWILLSLVMKHFINCGGDLKIRLILFIFKQFGNVWNVFFNLRILSILLCSRWFFFFSISLTQFLICAKCATIIKYSTWWYE